MDFSAKEPSLGYLYQIRYGLYLLLSSKIDTNTKLLIESLDDIEIVNENSINLYQTKFHLKRSRKISDRSSDFWKTIRVWCEQISTNILDINNTIFTLITTEEISNKSVLFDIKNKTNSEEVIKKLNVISTEKNKMNIKGYEAFNNLSDEDKEKLVNKIEIVDSSHDFESLDKNIEQELRLSVLPEHITPLYERIEGWFLKETIKHLMSQKSYISFNELQQQIIYITDKFKSDNLPIDFPDKIVGSDDLISSDIASMRFVNQLSLIDASERTKQNAISDYYRSFHQRSKWLNDELLDPQEEIDYEKRLVDDWERKFDLLLDDTDSKTDSEKKILSKLFYNTYYISNVPQVFIRERFRESYLALGSSHILSQGLKIGWHPDFKIFLSKVAPNDT